MSAIEVKKLVKKFHGQTVLHGIELQSHSFWITLLAIQLIFKIILQRR
jgi:ABC-type sugar transport system ATPase subunit